MITILYKYYSIKSCKTTNNESSFNDVENAVRFCYKIKENDFYFLDGWTTTTKEEEEEMHRRISLILFQKKGGSK